MNLNKQNAIIVAIILLVATFLIVSHCNKPVDQPVLDYNALKYSIDSMQTINNAISMDMADFKRIHLAKEDWLTRLLQAAVTSKTISAAVISTKTSIHDSGSTVVIVHDTIINKDSLPCDPTFAYDKTDTTQDVHVKANKNNTTVSLMLFNVQTVESKFESHGLLGLGTKSIILEVKNSNSKVITLNQISFVKPLPKSNRLVWLASGIIIGSVGVLYLKK